MIGKGITAFWQMVNDQGGINGRKINFITYDDGFQPPKTVEMVRKLVEDDQVFAIYQLLGTPTNTVVQKYLNQKKVPQLFVATGASKWGNPKEFPWTMGWQPDYATEAAIYAKHIMANHKGGKVGMLYQNDDSGKDYLNGFNAGFGKDQGQVPDQDGELRGHRSHRRQPGHPAQGFRRQRLLQRRGAQGRGAGDPQGRRSRLEARTLPRQRLGLGRLDLEAGGPRQQQGHHHRGLSQGSDRPAMGQCARLPRMEGVDGEIHAAGQHVGRLLHLCLLGVGTMRHVLTQCGDNLTRANLMKQAASMHDLVVPILLPGIKINTSPTDFYPIQSVQLARFDGETWKLFGDVLSSESS